MEQNFTIKNITKNSTNLEVDWSDGKTEWAALLRKLEREHSNYKN